ncbi:Brain-specific angiogenesis inhibitor 1-associated protein 2-like protein 1 [Characodon lateralis]|uniref:Brain-specific angiogenesis inhibitor 1-associated protein 2-like protein 1 n=1 Tax=Characodon lateralis TaxID=208331 RepID=A0ABU7D6Z2_9TELE|nr:Brain-specific angiogenesis inhibitor 1-associated protein 2-like protein 1 [Characodon lateralis]
MSKKVEEANKLAENTYKNVMEQFNPGLRNLVNLGKSYEKSVNAMSMAGKLYFDALSKIGENATGSPASKELENAAFFQLSVYMFGAPLETSQLWGRKRCDLCSQHQQP